MITGAHAVLYGADAEADRALLASLLDGCPSVDAGGGLTTIRPPGGIAPGLYEPRHPVAPGAE